MEATVCVLYFLNWPLLALVFKLTICIDFLWIYVVCRSDEMLTFEASCRGYGARSLAIMFALKISTASSLFLSASLSLFLRLIISHSRPFVTSMCNSVRVNHLLIYFFVIYYLKRQMWCREKASRVYNTFACLYSLFVVHSMENVHVHISIACRPYWLHPEWTASIHILLLYYMLCCVMFLCLVVGRVLHRFAKWKCLYIFLMERR